MSYAIVGIAGRIYKKLGEFPPSRDMPLEWGHRVTFMRRFTGTKPLVRDIYIKHRNASATIKFIPEDNLSFTLEAIGNDVDSLEAVKHAALRQMGLTQPAGMR